MRVSKYKRSFISDPVLPIPEKNSNMPFFYTDRSGKRYRRPTNDESGARILPNTTPDGLVLEQVPPCEIVKTNFGRLELRSEVQIFATPERLWQIITNDQKIISKQSGKIFEVDDRRPVSQEVGFKIVGKRGEVLKAVLNRLQVNREVGWKQRKFKFPGLLERQTLFQIAPYVEGTGVTLIRIEIFSGLAVPFLKGEARKVRTDIQLSNLEIREKAEAIS